jgi:hypothetical protein
LAPRPNSIVGPTKAVQYITPTRRPRPAQRTYRRRHRHAQAAWRPPPAAQGPYALEQAAKNFPVVIYTSRDCGDPCRIALDHLKKRDVPFTERIVTNEAGVDALTKLAGAARVPVLVVGTTDLKDYQKQDWNAALDTAGYAGTGTQ